MSDIYRLDNNYTFENGTEVSKGYFFDYEQTDKTYTVTFGDSSERLGDNLYTIEYDVEKDELNELLSSSSSL